MLRRISTCDYGSSSSCSEDLTILSQPWSGESKQCWLQWYTLHTLMKIESEMRRPVVVLALGLLDDEGPA